MKKIILIVICTSLFAETNRVVEIPDNITKDWFRQEAVINQAKLRQVLDINLAESFCKKNNSELKKTRDDQDQLVFVCVPVQENK